MESDIHGRDEVSVEDDGMAVASPHSAQDAFLGERSDLCMGNVIELVAEMPIQQLSVSWTKCPTIDCQKRKVPTKLRVKVKNRLSSNR